MFTYCYFITFFICVDSIEGTFRLLLFGVIFYCSMLPYYYLELGLVVIIDIMSYTSLNDCLSKFVVILIPLQINSINITII